MTTSDDALSDPVPVTRDMTCRARQSNGRYGQKMEQGMVDQGKPQRRTNNCRLEPEQTNYRAGQRRQFRTSQDQDHDMSRTMQGHCCGMGPVIAHGGKSQGPEGVRAGQ